MRAESLRLSSRSKRLDQRQSRSRRRSLIYPVAKRVLDIAFCLAILLPAVLIMLVIAVAILVDSGWPVLFSQERIGRGRRPFRLYKFRTLRRDYDPRLGRAYMQSYVRGQNRKGDSRGYFKPIEAGQITRVGNFLRRTSLDELPQIINVLRGEMSLVGPRPNVPWEVAAYRNWHYERLRVLPGITGLAQVHGRSGISFDQIARYDIAYVRERSLRLDLRILWWTVRAVLSRRGAG